MCREEEQAKARVLRILQMPGAAQGGEGTVDYPKEASIESRGKPQEYGL